MIWYYLISLRSRRTGFMNVPLLFGRDSPPLPRIVNAPNEYPRSCRGGVRKLLVFSAFKTNLHLFVPLHDSGRKPVDVTAF